MYFVVFLFLRVRMKPRHPMSLVTTYFVFFAVLRVYVGGKPRRPMSAMSPTSVGGKHQSLPSLLGLV